MSILSEATKVMGRTVFRVESRMYGGDWLVEYIVIHPEKIICSSGHKWLWLANVRAARVMRRMMERKRNGEVLPHERRFGA